MQSLESSLATYQSWRRLGEWILINGLVGELVLVIALDWWLDIPAHLEDKKRKAFAEMACTALILIGVGIETFAGGRADEVVRLMRAPRLLTPAQQTDLYARTKGFREKLDIFANRNVPEEFTLAIQIEAILSNAHWQVTLFDPMVAAFPIPGMYLEVDPKDPLAVSAATALMRAFESYDLQIFGPALTLPNKHLPGFFGPSGKIPDAPLRLNINPKE